MDEIESKLNEEHKCRRKADKAKAGVQEELDALVDSHRRLTLQAHKDVGARACPFAADTIVQKEDNHKKEAQLCKLFQELHDTKTHYDSIVTDMKARNSKTLNTLQGEKDQLQKANVKLVGQVIIMSGT
jgi:hypothetical protein